MKINNIKCLNYYAGEKFIAVFENTALDDVKNISPDNLNVTLDDNTNVESFTNYGRLFSIKQNFDDGTFEVEFDKVSDSEKRAENTEKIVEELKSRIQELEEDNKKIKKDAEKMKEDNKSIVDKLSTIKDNGIASLFKVKEGK